MPETDRLDRRLAQLVGCTVAEAEQYIRNGWVRVDGRVVEAPQHRIGVEDVQLDEGARLETVD